MLIVSLDERADQLLQLNNSVFRRNRITIGSPAIAYGHIGKYSGGPNRCPLILTGTLALLDF